MLGGGWRQRDPPAARDLAPDPKAVAGSGEQRPERMLVFSPLRKSLGEWVSWE